MVGSSPELAIDGDSGTCARTPRTAAQRWWQVAFTRKALVRTVRIVTEGQVFLPSYFDFLLFSFFKGKITEITENIFRHHSQHPHRSVNSVEPSAFTKR